LPKEANPYILNLLLLVANVKEENMNKQALVIKTGVEIGSLISQLNSRNQSYAQQVNFYGKKDLKSK
jgi:hypothetical protein